MRLIHDAPRSWPDLWHILSPEDIASVVAFARQLGTPLSGDTEPETVEAIYAAWCADPAPARTPVH
jgi:hypothetical protein